MNAGKKIILLHWNGRFGNRMFTYAFLRHYADEFGMPAWLPSGWEGELLFAKSKLPIIDDDTLRLHLNQTHPDFDTLPARLAAIRQYNLEHADDIRFINPDNSADYGNLNCCIDSLCCYHPSIFSRYSRQKMLTDYFCFSDLVKRSDLYKRMEDEQGKFVVAHLRRDDIADPRNNTNRGYSVVSKASYQQAFEQYGYDPATVRWVTDDRSGSWGITAPVLPDNWTYPTGSQYYPQVIFSWLPDFLRMVFAKALFRANSSFSWWAGFFCGGQVYAPRLLARKLFHETQEELLVDFEQGNHPHWICVKGVDGCDDITIPS